MTSAATFTLGFARRAADEADGEDTERREDRRREDGGFRAANAVVDDGERVTAMTDPVDVAALFAAHAPFLLRAVERLTARGPHVEDIVQDVFVVAHRRRHELQVIGREGTSLRGWLYGVARKRAAQHRRSIFRWLRLRDAVDVEPRPPSGSPDDVVARFDDALRVRRCALALPFAQREVFALHEFEAMSAPQIAAFLGVPEGTVWSRLTAARRQFRELHTHDGAPRGTASPRAATTPAAPRGELLRTERGGT
jgi:RNA polymerase sigma-70 factor (ECF subfamily)